MYRLGDSNTVTQYAKVWGFPAGERGVALLPHAKMEIRKIFIEPTLRDSDEVMELLMFVDAVRREYPKISIELSIPYLPYARQDRVCGEGESLSICVMTNLINSIGADVVRLYDPHSDVAPALIKNSVVSQQTEIWKWLWSVGYADYDVVVAPDAGAYKKAVKMAEFMGVDRVLVANKVRGEGGKIVRHELSGSVDGLRVAIFDDICDGGQTFINLSQILEGCSWKSLFVTHGIFTKGVEHVTKHFDRVHTTNSYNPNLEETDVLRVYKKFY